MPTITQIRMDHAKIHIKLGMLRKTFSPLMNFSSISSALDERLVGRSRKTKLKNFKVNLLFTSTSTKKARVTRFINKNRKLAFLTQFGNSGYISKDNHRMRSKEKPSKILSIIMVAKVALREIPSLVPKEYARTNSPNLAGNTLLAIKPIITEEKRLPSPTFLIGLTINFHRYARIHMLKMTKMTLGKIYQ